MGCKMSSGIIDKNIIPDEETLKAGLYSLVDFSRPVFYFPVRHHSPICSYFLQKTIKEYKPDCILIEGPEDANELKDVLASENLETPIAIYYSFKDKEEVHRCYYPFLDYSPELVALREAQRLGIPASFFDLGYAEIINATQEGRGLKKDQEKVNYNDDSYISESTFMKGLVEKAGLRCFDEFWEKYFEIECLSGTLKDFLKTMLLYCGMCRAVAPMQELEEDGCLAREAHMRENIETASKKYKRILVVTGGFHTPGLALSDELFRSKDNRKTGKKEKSAALSKEDKGVYVMSYSMEAADALNGYASGMPYPAFYQSVWESINKGEGMEAYSSVVLAGLVRVGKNVRAKDGATSTADEIAALSMAANLASLRGKDVPGAFELTDSVLSSFVKGELSPASNLPMKELRKILTGKKIGRLPVDAKLPPLVHDFEEKCRKYRLDIHATVKKEVTLQIFANEKHRDESAFFHSMCFLGSGFASRKRGPNLHTGIDRNLIRETWEYRWNTALNGILIDNSVYGGTIEEACTAIVKKKTGESLNSAEVAELLLSSFEMGIDIQGEMIKRLQEIMQADSDFFSLSKAFSSVNMLDRLSSLYRNEMSFSDIKDTLFRKILSLLPGMAELRDEDLERTLSSISEMYYEAGKTEEFLGVLKILASNEKIHPGLLGAVQGILYSAAELSGDEVCTTAKGFMNGTSEKRLKTAAYLRGLFYTARDLIFSSMELIEMLDAFLGEVEVEPFLKLLPQLRLAFGSFTPREIDRIAEKVAGKLGVKAGSILEGNNVSAEGFEYGRSLDERILKLLGK